MTRADTWSPGNLAAVASVAGLAAYGWVRAANEGFYSTYGITIEEAGVQSHAMVARTLVLAGAWALIGLFLAAVLALVVGGTWLFDRWFDRTLDLEHLSNRELAVGLLAAVLLATGGLVVMLREDAALGALAGVAVAAGVAAAARAGGLLRRLTGIRHGRVILVAIAGTAYLIGIFACLSTGSEWGRRSRSEATPTLGAAILISRWPASGLLEQPPAGLPAQLLLLGASEGIAVLYDVDGGAVLRVPAEQTTFVATGTSGRAGP